MIQMVETSDVRLSHTRLYYLRPPISYRFPAESRANELTYGRPNWFDRVEEEHKGCRENVALFDLSASAKLEIEVHN